MSFIVHFYCSQNVIASQNLKCLYKGFIILLILSRHELNSQKCIIHLDTMLDDAFFFMQITIQISSRSLSDTKKLRQGAKSSVGHTNPCYSMSFFQWVRIEQCKLNTREIVH